MAIQDRHLTRNVVPVFKRKGSALPHRSEYLRSVDGSRRFTCGEKVRGWGTAATGIRGRGTFDRERA
jgi:hypothetical protein